MRIKDFKLERYFAKHEFSAKYLLSSSDCDGFSLKYLLEIATKSELALWENMSFGYTESEGHSLLRSTILQFYKTKSIENVIVATPGELNFATMNVLLKPDDHVVSVAPSYQSLYEVIKSIKCNISYWKPNPENWTFNTDELERLIQKETKLIVLNFPHNPTGSYITKSQLNEIIRIARKHQVYIFSDEMYSKLVHSGREELPPISDLYEKGISLWGTSKTFGLAGLRTGWIVSQDQTIIQKVLAFKDYLSICNAAPSEILSIIALNHIDDFLLPNLKKIQANITLFEEFAGEHDLIEKFIAPQAGSTSFVKLNIVEKTALEFSNKLVGKIGIMTVPSEMFEYEGKYIRVGFGRKNFPDVLDQLSSYFNSQ